MGFLPLDIGKVIYGGFNPAGTTRDPLISLGRSISHGIRPGTRPDLLSPVYGNTPTGYPPLDDSGLPPAAQVDEPVVQANRDFPAPTATELAAAHYASIARQPSSTPGGGPGGPMAPDWAQNATRPTYAGPGYTDPRSANAFIPGLIDWNGPGATNPIGNEDRVDTKHNIGALAAKLGMMGLSRGGGGGLMPGRIK